MVTNRLEQELRDYFKAEVRQQEPSADWWNNIVASLEERSSLSFWQRFKPKTRLAWAFVPIALLVIIGGTAYAATFVIKELFLNYAGHIEEAGLAQELDISQTIGNVTVRLERAYADGNVVLVGYTVSGPQERYFTRGGELITDEGQALPPLFGMGFVPGSERIMSEWRPSDRVAYLAGYDASLIKGEPPYLNLTLDIQVSDPPFPGKPLPSFESCTFDFTVPFARANRIVIEQTVEKSGVAITLDRIEITPWATMAVFRFSQDGTPIVSVKLPDGRSDETFGRAVDDPSGEYRSYFNEDFTGQHGVWTITINELVLPPDISEAEKIELVEGKAWIIKSKGDNQDNRLTGPWVFTFEVP